MRREEMRQNLTLIKSSRCSCGRMKLVGVYNYESGQLMSLLMNMPIPLTSSFLFILFFIFLFLPFCSQQNLVNHCAISYKSCWQLENLLAIWWTSRCTVDLYHRVDAQSRWTKIWHHDLEWQVSISLHGIFHCWILFPICNWLSVFPLLSAFERYH